MFFGGVALLIAGAMLVFRFTAEDFESNGETVPTPAEGALHETTISAIRSGSMGAPTIRSTFDLYLREGRLVYFRQPCAPEDLRSRFLLHLFDHDRVGQGARGAFENRDFDFRQYGGFSGVACAAIVPLPERGIASVRTGQWTPGESPSWTAVVRVDPEPHRAALDSIRDGSLGAPATHGPFDLYREGPRLLYHREDCREADFEAPFFLDLYASQVEALPAHRRESGFEALRFPFANHGVVLDGHCVLLVTVPDYGIRRLTTGQSDADDRTLWQVEIEPGG